MNRNWNLFLFFVSIAVIFRARVSMNQNPNIAFFGSPLLAAECLRRLIKSFTVSMVITKPDRKAGRGMKPVATPVKEAAVDHGIDVYQPERPDEDLVQSMAVHRVDLIVVAAYGKILPESVIAHPALGGFNLHTSLLPKYRGPSPIEASILNGEKNTGITVQVMTGKMDAGDILSQKVIPLTLDMNASDLLKEIIRIAPEFLLQSVLRYAEGVLRPQPQNESEATYCAQIRKEDGWIDWHDSASVILNRIRAFDIWPVACSMLEGKRVRVYRARVADLPTDEDALPGQIVGLDRNKGVLVQTGGGIIGLLELQPENRKRMGFRQFINGYRGIEGKRLRTPGR